MILLSGKNLDERHMKIDIFFRSLPSYSDEKDPVYEHKLLSQIIDM